MVFTSAEAGLFGRFDSVAIVDNRIGSHSSYIEEQIDLSYVDEEAGWRLGTAMDLRLEYQNEWIYQNEIYHLFGEKMLNGEMLSSVTLGRMQRSDALGFYTLDGIQLLGNVRQWGTQGFSLYAGRPQRVDDFHMVEADLLVGGALQWDRQSLSYTFNQIEISSLSSRLELQYLQKEVHENRLNWSVNAAGQRHQSRLSDLKLNFGGSYQFGQQQMEELLLSAEVRDGRSEYLKLNYQSYRPAAPTLTFREQYYSLYVLGRQSEFAVSYQLQPKNRLAWGLKSRLVTRENGMNGIGLTGTLNRWRFAGLAMSSQLDLLKLGQDSATTLYFEGERALTALSRLNIALMMQQQKKQLMGDNDAVGIDGELEQMLSSSLFLGITGMHIWNSRLPDEYRYGIRLSYRFDDRKAWLSE